MKRVLSEDLKKLSTMAFGRLKHCGPLLKRFHELTPQIEKTGQPELIWKAYDWLLVPFMLWPHEFEGMVKTLLSWLEEGKQIDDTFWFLLKGLGETPPKS